MTDEPKTVDEALEALDELRVTLRGFLRQYETDHGLIVERIEVDRSRNLAMRPVGGAVVHIVARLPHPEECFTITKAPARAESEQE